MKERKTIMLSQKAIEKLEEAKRLSGKSGSQIIEDGLLSECKKLGRKYS